MNHRLLLPASVQGDPLPEAWAQVRDTLSEISGETAAVFEARLRSDPAWLLDLPTESEATRMVSWVLATTRVRCTIVPSVGAPAASRAAGLALLERRRAAVEASARGGAEDAHAAMRRRADEARERARALAAARAEASAGTGPRPQAGQTSGGHLRIGDPSGRSPSRPIGVHGEAGPAVVESPIVELNLRPERSATSQWLGVGLVVVVIGAVLGTVLFGGYREAELAHAVAAAATTLESSARIDRRTVRELVRKAVDEAGYDPTDHRIEVFIAPDEVAAGLDHGRGLPPRDPEPGVRVRARVRGDGQVGLWTRSFDFTIDVLIPQGAAVKGTKSAAVEVVTDEL
jgi:hypothetical protein